MAFIRVKHIKQKQYAYLVESIKTAKGPRQKVKQYLGRVHILEQQPKPQQPTPAAKKEIQAATPKAFLQDLITQRLIQHNFVYKNNICQKEGITFYPPESKIVKQKREAILKIGDGYLCSFTIQRILNFSKSDDWQKDAYILARYFLEAGLNISENEFVRFYQML